jgi:hypothetical protein
MQGECIMAGLAKKGNTYYALFSINGKTKWKRIGIMPYKDALKALRNIEATFDKEKVGIKEMKSITFNDFSPLYLNYSRANKAHRTWERDGTSIRTLTPYFGNMILQAIDNRNMELYKAKRQTEGVKPRTINIELKCLRHMLSKALEWNYLNKIPPIKLLKEEKKPPRFLSY